MPAPLTYLSNSAVLSTWVTEHNNVVDYANALDPAKASNTYVVAQLAGKAANSYVVAQLALKAANSYVNTQLGSKAANTYVNIQLGTKAANSYVVSQLALKAANSYVNSLNATSFTIVDAGGIITATTIEGALQENRTAIDAIEADYLMSTDIGSSVQAYDAATAKLDVEGQTLTGGVAVTVDDLGVISSGTVTIDVSDRPIAKYTSNGAHTLDVGTSNYGSCILLIQNGSNANTITTSGFDLVDGDSFTANTGHLFRCVVEYLGVSGTKYLNVRALQ